MDVILKWTMQEFEAKLISVSAKIYFVDVTSWVSHPGCSKIPCSM